MTSKEYLQRQENEIRRLEIRKMTETDPVVIKVLGKLIKKRKQFTDGFRKAFCSSEINYAALDHNGTRRNTNENHRN